MPATHWTPTKYNGTQYRSKTEALWAHFFNLCGIDVAYEPARFRLTRSLVYIPDFWVKDGHLQGHHDKPLWIEIKGPPPTKHEMQKSCTLGARTKTPSVIIQGNPKAYRILEVWPRRRRGYILALCRACPGLWIISRSEYFCPDCGGAFQNRFE